MFILNSIRVEGSLGGVHKALVSMKKDSQLIEPPVRAEGIGPVDALYSAILKAANRTNEVYLNYFHIVSEEIGAKSFGIATVELIYENKFFRGRDRSENVLFAAGLSLVKALNNIDNGRDIDKITRDNVVQEPDFPGREQIVKIKSYRYSSRYSVEQPSNSSEVRLTFSIREEVTRELYSSGNGLIEAGIKVVNNLSVFQELQPTPTLTQWSVEGLIQGAVDGTNDIGVSIVAVKGVPDLYKGDSQRVDIIYASIEAYIKAMEKYRNSYIDYRSQSRS
jgi:hypothetical protein